MLSNIFWEKNLRHKAHGHAFGLRVKAMLLAQCKLFDVKEFLITDYSKEFCNAVLGK
jgi:hypothetical protein